MVDKGVDVKIVDLVLSNFRLEEFIGYIFI